LRIKAEQLGDRLKDYPPNAQIILTCFHQDELKNFAVTLTEPRPTTYQLVAVPAPTSQQQANLKGWLGVAIADGNGE